MRSNQTTTLPSALSAILVGIATATILTLVYLIGTYEAPGASTATRADALALRASILWAISFSALITVIFWNAILALRMIQAYAGRVTKLVTVTLLGVSMISAAILSILNWSRLGLLSIVINKTGIRALHRVTLIGNVLATGCAILIVMACVALATRGSEQPTPFEIRRRDTDAQRLLFSTAAFLAIGLAAVYLVLTWLSSIQDARSSPEQQFILQHISLTIAIAEGAFYTGVLVALFAPVAIAHSKWVDEAWEADTGKPSGQKRSEWLAVNGLDKSFPATTAQVGAVVAPWLLALIKSLVKL